MFWAMRSLPFLFSNRRRIPGSAIRLIHSLHSGQAFHIPIAGCYLNT